MDFEQSLRRWARIVVARNFLSIRVSCTRATLVYHVVKRYTNIAQPLCSGKCRWSFIRFKPRFNYKNSSLYLGGQILFDAMKVEVLISKLEDRNDFFSCQSKKRLALRRSYMKRNVLFKLSRESAFKEWTKFSITPQFAIRLEFMWIL